MRERILAVAGALALVAGAFVIRSVVTGDDGGGGRRNASRPVVACTPDLMVICDALVAEKRIRADPPALDLDAAAEPAPAVDAWITWDPAPGIANLDAEKAGTDPAWDTPMAIGSSPLAVATRSSGSETPLPDGCSLDKLTWGCLARPRGLTVGVGTGRTSESLARLSPIANELVPKDRDFTDINPGELGAIVESPADRQDLFPAQLRTIRTTPGALNLVVGPRGALEAASGLEVSVPTPAATMVAVVTPRTGGRIGAETLDGLFDADRVREAIGDAGLTPATGRLAPPDRAGELYQVRQKVG